MARPSAAVRGLAVPGVAVGGVAVRGADGAAVRRQLAAALLLSLSPQLQFNICVRTNTKPDFVISFSPRSRRVARFVSYYVLLPCTQGYCQAVVRMYRVIDSR